MLRLTVEPLDLGPDVRALALNLTAAEDQEPVAGSEAAPLWSQALLSLAGEMPLVLDFFAHLDRVREFCQNQDIRFRETAAGGIAVTETDSDALGRLMERFEGETWGARAGEPLRSGDEELENALRRRGLDAYHLAFPRYLFCAVCELDTGSVTLVSDQLWASEVSRRLRGALREFPVSVEMLM
ncbi:MAG TPA: hypothetical protein VNJ52_02135 [Patescibacteria group bacterium]|nr:hypothetical protein [Patescibacteria group bacterium]